VTIGLHLERVQPVCRILQPSVPPQTLQPVPEVEQVEAQPRVTRVACLPEVNHLVVLQLVIVAVEVVGLLLGVRQYEAEERQGRITGSQQEGIADGRHVDDAAWPHSLERQSYDAKHIVHGCKGTNKRA